MAIINFVHQQLRALWECDDDGWIPISHRHNVRNALFDLDASTSPMDLRDIGAVNSDGYYGWHITITVNTVEPCAAVTCKFYQGDCYELDYREYNP